MSKIQFFSILFVCSIIGNVWTAPAFNPNSYRQAIINYGRTLNRDISQKLVRKIYSFNGQIREFAGDIPSDSGKLKPEFSYILKQKKFPFSLYFSFTGIGCTITFQFKHWKYDCSICCTSFCYQTNRNRHRSYC